MNANFFIYIGVVFILIGVAYKYGLLDWFGNLPGDIKYKGEDSFVFIPITSMLLVSAILSFIIRFFNR